MPRTAPAGEGLCDHPGWNSYVGKQLSFSYERKRIVPEQNDTTRALVGKYVDTQVFADGRLQVRWRGLSLPYIVFDKDRRVSHPAVVENKHLSAVLSQVREQPGEPAGKAEGADRQREDGLSGDWPKTT